MFFWTGRRHGFWSFFGCLFALSGIGRIPFLAPVLSELLRLNVETNSHRFSHIHTQPHYSMLFLALLIWSFFFLFLISPHLGLCGDYLLPLAPVHRCHCASSSWFPFVWLFVWPFMCSHIVCLSSFILLSRGFAVILRLFTHTVALRNRGFRETAATWLKPDLEVGWRPSR